MSLLSSGTTGAAAGEGTGQKWCLCVFITAEVKGTDSINEANNDHKFMFSLHRLVLVEQH